MNQLKNICAYLFGASLAALVFVVYFGWLIYFMESITG